MSDPGDPTNDPSPGTKSPEILPFPHFPNPPSKYPAGNADTSGSSAPKTNGAAMNVTPDESHANSSTKVEALRAQGQALTFIAQALLMQIQALNTQVDALSG